MPKNARFLDKKRDRWAEIVLGTKWDDPSLYDIAINIDSVSLDNAVTIIENMTKMEEYTPDASTTKSLNDLSLSATVWASLTSNLKNRSIQIHIDSDDGKVTLSGNVISRKIADAIIHLTNEVDGVQELEDCMQIGNTWIL